MTKARSYPKVATREEWLAARKELLAREKASTREGDAVNGLRRRLPMPTYTLEPTLRPSPASGQADRASSARLTPAPGAFARRSTRARSSLRSGPRRDRSTRSPAGFGAATRRRARGRRPASRETSTGG